MCLTPRLLFDDVGMRLNNKLFFTNLLHLSVVCLKVFKTQTEYRHKKHMSHHKLRV